MRNLIVFLALLGAASFDPATQAAPAADSKAADVKTKEVKFDVEGMKWSTNCPKSVKKTLEALPWVKKVEVKFKDKVTIVTVEEDKYKEDDIVKKLKDAGYEAKLSKDKDK